MNAANSALSQLTDAISKSASEAMNAVATFWIKSPTPEIAYGADTGAPRNTEIVQYLQDNVLGISMALFTLAILVAAIRTAWEQRAEPLRSLLQAILTFVVVSAAGTATMQLLITYSDQLAVRIIQQVQPDQSKIGPMLVAMVFKASLGDNVSGLILMFAGVIVVIAGVVQVALMLVRSALLILLAGTFPLAASATNTEVGRNWLRKYCNWSLAFIAYKPAAALIYAAAMKMNEMHITAAKTDEMQAAATSNSFVQTTTGLMMLLMAIAALPALLRFIVPVTAAVAGGSSGMGTAAVDPGGSATGALNIASSRGAAGAGKAGAGAGASGGGAAAAGGPAGAALAGAAMAVNGARKAAGGAAGAAAHSAGESAGGAATPTSSFSSGGGSGGGAGGGPGGSSGARSAPSSSSTARPRTPRPTPPPDSSGQEQDREPAWAGPSGNW
ncbi:hypothetical protein JOF29_005077 [Kribbella aluminosa]|uniref:TrbL/VirB6 plasmid conjugal transfer protein n=1 Tax=Kribbella aluminosa TaxID=416017 RepID=A0ABS4UQQ3_9ACTN|nr:hypothetical protein [Kribbella aluminosa]MBP2353967.1 hypothetical protein [Kribbella aluminosa]